MHALRHKPIGALSVQDLRLPIGQNIGLTHLLPRPWRYSERILWPPTTSTKGTCSPPS
ncbi:hypothetical protein [Streptomyces sp. NBC_01396]|uniref:hypothetical protein n=1 Tax=unclassified Streptomyces TaxID=2593676 RepID=UPI003867E3B6